MSKGRDHVEDVEHALERLFRLTMNRKVHSRQSAAVGADVTARVTPCCATSTRPGNRASARSPRMLHGPRGGRPPGPRARERRLRRAFATTDDGRVTVVRLTDAGLDVYRRIVDVRHRVHGRRARRLVGCGPRNARRGSSTAWSRTSRPRGSARRRHEGSGVDPRRSAPDRLRGQRARRPRDRRGGRRAARRPAGVAHRQERASLRAGRRRAVRQASRRHVQLGIVGAVPRGGAPRTAAGR